MRIFKAKFVIMTVLVLVFLVYSCGPKIKPQSELDDPRYHFNLGMRMLENGEIKSAQEAFERAIGLDKKFARAYGGLALVYAVEKKFDNANKNIEIGLFYNETDPFLWVCKARVQVLERKGKNWIKDVEWSFDKALQYAQEESDREVIYYYRGLAYKAALKFDRAGEDFKRVIAIDGAYAGRANKEWEIIQKIQRAAPGTIAGKKVALIDEIDRADLAVLIAEELRVSDLIKKRSMQPDIAPGYLSPEELKRRQQQEMGSNIIDIQGHFAEKWIEEVVDLGIMELYPGNRFLPDQKITRANFAMAIQNILIAVTQNNELATMYIGQPGGPSDVSPTSYAYNAIRLCLERGIMKLDLASGRFYPNAPVSGADALLFIRELKNSLK